MKGAILFKLVINAAASLSFQRLILRDIDVVPMESQKTSNVLHIRGEKSSGQSPVKFVIKSLISIMLHFCGFIMTSFI